MNFNNMAKKKVTKKIETADGNKELVQKKDVAGKNQKQTEIIVGIVIGILLLLVVLVIYATASNKFEYLGMKFKKISYGDIILYSTSVPVTNGGQITGYIAVDFRNDPRTLKDIPIDVPNGIRFLKSKLVYLSVDEATGDCEDSGLAIINFGGLFLKNAGFEVKVASMYRNYSEQQKIPYVNCGNNLNDTVILIKRGNETKIKEKTMNCYEVSFKDCEILKAVEKVELEVLKDYMAKFS